MRHDSSARRVLAAAALCAFGLVGSQAQGVIPVIDLAAIRQLLQEVTAWREQLAGMQQQITQLRQTYAAMTGSRGMELLLPLSPAARNYLPPDWTALAATLSGASRAYSGLTTDVRAQLSVNTVLAETDLARFPVPLRALLETERQAVAGGQAFTRLAYRQSSDRFTSLTTLIDRIGTTGDEKAIEELQGRIQAEQAMLANDSLKLFALAQMTIADGAARDLARREQTVANHGAFATRFQPAPPAP